MPLTSHGPSGAKYRLRDAEFEINANYWYYGDYGLAGSGSAGAPSPGSIVVSSEDDPDADSIVLDLEEGDYYLTLRPGWRLEKVTNAGVETVEATLLSDATQWVWVSRRSTSWVEYEFGLGDRSVWMNGKLNVDIQVHEDPGDLGYGGFGSGGSYGVGGYGSAGSYGRGGASY